MISRRNIRIKVFQTIYEQALQEENIDIAKAEKQLEFKFQETKALVTAILHLVYLISEYVLVYANQKASKHRPTEEDLKINVKLAGNIIMKQLKQNVHFEESVKKNKIAHLFDDDLVKKIFLQLIETAEYKSYIHTAERNAIDEKKMILFIVDFCIFNAEDTTTFLSEKYMNWFTDAEMIKPWIDKIFMKASTFPFNQMVSYEKRTYADDLLRCYYEKKEIIFQLIDPKLVNWDADRVAIIDLILLHLGICELLYFPTIPVKVTINEYIDLAKEYSTLQSGQFVNGLLDNVHKELLQENKIQKTDYAKKN